VSIVGVHTIAVHVLPLRSRPRPNPPPHPVAANAHLPPSAQPRIPQPRSANAHLPSPRNPQCSPSILVHLHPHGSRAPSGVPSAPARRSPIDVDAPRLRGSKANKQHGARGEEVRGLHQRSPTHLLRDPRHSCRSPSIDDVASTSATSAHLQEQPVRLAPHRALTTQLSCCSNHCSPTSAPSIGVFCVF
jgi:hypothetical protein